jgi:hypothetical protein
MEGEPVESSTPVNNTFAYLIKSNWQKYILDIVVIIIGITLSFAVNSWKENVEKENLEQTYLLSLSEDFTADIAELNDVITQTQDVIAAATALSSVPNSSTAPEFLTEKILAIAKRPNFVSKDATFTDLQSSGNLQIFSDAGFKNMVIDYYRSYEAVLQVQTAEREIMNGVIGEYLLDNFPLSGVNNASKISDKEELSADRFTHTFMFRNIIAVRILNRKELLSDYQSLLDIAQAIKKQIDTKIHK